MKTILLGTDVCLVLFHLVKQNGIERAQTERKSGLAVFDSQTGQIETGNAEELNEGEMWKILERGDHQIQMLAELDLIPPASFPPHSIFLGRS